MQMFYLFETENQVLQSLSYLFLLFEGPREGDIWGENPTRQKKSLVFFQMSARLVLLDAFDVNKFYC